MPENSDPYLYPGTSILRNIPWLLDHDALNEFEATASHARNLELREYPTKGKFDNAHIQAIHKTLFQDVYDWEGQFRTVNISKGGNLFGSAQFIEMALGGILEKLSRENFIQHLDRETMTTASRESFATGNNQSMVAIIRACTR